MKYKEIVDSVCGHSWTEAGEDERNGGYGVACLIAFMKGADAREDSIASHLGVDSSKIQTPFLRLFKSGIFSKTFDARSDKWLLGSASPRQSQCAWGNVAGVAGGFIYRNFDNSKKDIFNISSNI